MVSSFDGGKVGWITIHRVEFYQKMSMRKRISIAVLALASLSLVIALPARAVTIDVDLSGQFQADSDVFTVNFSLDSDRLVSFFTSSWISAGSGLGFDTALFLWDSSGNWLGFPSGYSDDVGLSGSALSNGTSYGYGENDVFLNSFLAAGTYTATLVQTGNLPVGFPGAAQLSNGFTQASSPNYTRDIYGWGTEEYFNGAAGNDPRTGDWAFHMIGISDYAIPGSPVPEPTTLTLLLLGAGGCVLRFRRS